MEIKFTFAPKEIIRNVGVGRLVVLCVCLLIGVWIVSSKVIQSNQPPRIECLYTQQMFSGKFAEGDSAVYLNGKRLHFDRYNDFCKEAPEGIRKIIIR